MAAFRRRTGRGISMFLKEMKKGQCGRIPAGILSFAILAALLAGCGNGMDSVDGPAENISSDSGNESGQSSPQSPDSTAMGRYVEEIIDLSDRISYGNNLYRLENGELIITDYLNDFLRSSDNGAAWEADIRSWRDSLPGPDSIENLAIGGDNTMAVIYDAGGEDSSEENPFVVDNELMLIKPDGMQAPVEVPLTEEDESCRMAWISDQGRIFVSTYGPNLYEVKEDGSSELFLTLPSAPMLLQFQNSLMILDGWDYETLLIYDMEKREYIEDEVLCDFVKENYSDRSNNGGSWYDLYFFMGEENILYLAGKNGLYRHVIGGNAIEQVIDGRLSVFNNPAYRLRGMLALDNSEFLALFGNGTMVKFTYNPDIPTVPEEKLKVYSLKESNTIRQAVMLYQMAYPEVCVEYEIGMEEGSSITREDALKSLNTRMMAEDGPDILILDHMPVDSYVEKGLLRDLSSVLDSPEVGDAVFDNLVDAFRRDGKIYMMPCEIELPVVFGPESCISGAGDLSDIAEAMEELRKTEPGKNLIGPCSAPEMMRLFSMISTPCWITETGEIDRKALEDFLMQVKRIYDAQMDGLSEEAFKQYSDVNDMITEIYGNSPENDSEMVRENLDYMDYLMGRRMMICSLMSSDYEYAALCSIQRMDQYGNNEIALMGGNVFYPRTLTGISAVSEKPEYAEAFLRLLLGTENQTSLFHGFAVNREAFDNVLKVEIGEDEEYSNLAMMDEEGRIFELTVYWPLEAQVGVLRNFMETVTVPYIEDTMLEEAVYEAGAAYLRGEQSLEDTLDAIGKRASLYMAE